MKKPKNSFPHSGFLKQLFVILETFQRQGDVFKCGKKIFLGYEIKSRLYWKAMVKVLLLVTLRES